ncbi:MAG: hypothetical protein IJ608_05625 [Lachnospiraceae bacterium]|nr:hypothetical protein [Lachnospiraceae bacterium]
MLAKIFTEPEINTVLRRYDPEGKLLLDTERSYMDKAIFCEPGADLNDSGYLKVRYIRPHYLSVERWQGSHQRIVSALYQKTDTGYKRLMSKKYRKNRIQSASLFENADGSDLSSGHVSDDNAVTGQGEHK